MHAEDQLPSLIHEIVKVAVQQFFLLNLFHLAVSDNEITSLQLYER